MRTHPILLLALALLIAACANDDGLLTDGPSAEGTVLVSTSTAGNDPDQDGYALAVDSADTTSLAPTGTVAIGLSPGRHALRLLDVAPQCSVASDTVLEVDVPSRDTVPVAFDISCSAGGALITITTTGLDFDPYGYRLFVDGAQQGHIEPNARVLTRLEPGSRTIALTGLTPNCTIAGPTSRTVTVVDTEVVPIDFAVACTAVSGVVEIVINASGPLVYEGLEAKLDGSPLRIGGIAGEPDRLLAGLPNYLSGIQAGDRVVTLVDSPECSVETGPQTASVTVGGPVRDTVEVDFSVTCSLPREDTGTLRISAPTTGSTLPSTRYTARYASSDYWDPGSSDFVFLDTLEPDGTLVTDAAASGFGGGSIYWYDFELDGVPANCSVRNPTPPLSSPYGYGFKITAGDTLNLVFAVTCPP